MRLTPELLSSLEEVVNNEQNPIEYLSFDPGKDNGATGYDSKYYLSFMLTVAEQDMLDFLKCFKHVKKVTIENFTLFPHKRTEQNYSDMLTSRVIGRVEVWSQLNEVELIKQSPNIKRTGYAWIGIPSPSKSNPKRHELDAHAHFVYRAVKNGWIKAEDLLKKPNGLLS